MTGAAGDSDVPPGPKPSQRFSGPLWVFHVVLVASGAVFAGAYGTYVLLVPMRRLAAGESAWSYVLDAGLFYVGAAALGVYLVRFLACQKRTPTGAARATQVSSTPER